MIITKRRAVKFRVQWATKRLLYLPWDGFIHFSREFTVIYSLKENSLWC